MDYKDIINDEINKFINEYDDTIFKSKISKQTKKMASEFIGRNITWFGTKGKSAIIPISDFDGMWGNIYNEEKIERLVNKIQSMDENIELEASYCIPYIVGLQIVKEMQESESAGTFSTDNENMTKVLSTDDDELDKYIGSYDNLEDIDELAYVDSDFIPLVKKYHLDIGQNTKSLANFKKDLVMLVRENDLERSEAVEVYQYVKHMEEKLYEALENNWGDLGSMRFQLRDGHHRWKAAVELGERYVLCDIHDFDMSEVAKYVKTL